MPECFNELVLSGFGGKISRSTAVRSQNNGEPVKAGLRREGRAVADMWISIQAQRGLSCDPESSMVAYCVADKG